MPLKPSLRAICHYRALSAFTVYNRGGGRNSSVLGGFFWPSVGLLARTAGKSLKPWLLVNEGGLSTVPCCWFAIRIATRDSSRFVGNPYLGIISGLSVIRLEPAPREFALSDVRPLSLVFRAKAAHLIRRAPRRWLPRARNRSRLLVIVRRASSSRSRHESELRATQCCLESAG